MRVTATPRGIGPFSPGAAVEVWTVHYLQLMSQREALEVRRGT
jgi:hypothetical protein